MAKDIRELPKSIQNALQRVGMEESCTIVSDVLNEIEQSVPTDTWRLIDSGFGYVNGQLVSETDQGRSHNKLGIYPPENPPAGMGGDGHYDISIVYHTPKPNKKYGVFDYAPFVLEGQRPGSKGNTSFVRSDIFRSRRFAAYKGMASGNSALTRAQMESRIKAGIDRGLGEVARMIVKKLSRI